MSGINKEAWLKALGETGLKVVDEQEALTIQELMKEFDLSERSARRYVECLVGGGKARQTSKRVMREGGSFHHVRAWKLLEE